MHSHWNSVFAYVFPPKHGYNRQQRQNLRILKLKFDRRTEWREVIRAMKGDTEEWGPKAMKNEFKEDKSS